MPLQQQHLPNGPDRVQDSQRCCRASPPKETTPIIHDVASSSLQGKGAFNLTMEKYINQDYLVTLSVTFIHSIASNDCVI
jgi:hypothetical protein